MSKKNAIVGQSGGPTAAINATLAGVIMQAAASEEIDILCGALHGIKGLMQKDIINLNERFELKENIELLTQTPSAYLGSCRYKLNSDEDVDKVIDILKEYNIGYFFYIGGNDSMDTVDKLSEKAYENDIKVIGIPKSIDNDLSVTDHCPGFGSCAKYISTVTSEVFRDTSCYDVESVTILEIMGRNAGWLTAASSLARINGASAPHLIYLPERPFSINKFLSDVKEKINKYKNVIVAISEGIKTENGEYIAASSELLKEDLFGHAQLGGAGKVLENIIAKELKVKVRSIELNTPQRCAGHLLSQTDTDESIMIGASGVQAAIAGENGKMMVYKRVSNSPYEVISATADIKLAANEEKTVPDEYINSQSNDVTEAFTEYCLPLIQGEPKIKFKNGIPIYITV